MPCKKQSFLWKFLSLEASTSHNNDVIGPVKVCIENTSCRLIELWLSL